jgi:hypothetical protein
MNLLREYWPFWLTAIALAILNMILFVSLKGPWGTTGGVAHILGKAIEAIGITFPLQGYLKAKVVKYAGIVIGMMIGAFIASYIAGDFRIRVPPKEQAVISFIGGLLMGFGMTYAFACNVGHILSGVPQLAASSFVYLIVLIMGAWVGTQIIKKMVK